jgi:thioredoxin 1
MSTNVVYVSEVTTNNFNDFISHEGIAVVDIWAEWCNPCKVLSPIVDMVASEFTSEGANVKVGKLNVDVNREVAADLGVTSIPTIVIYKNGEIVDKHTGMLKKDKLKELIQKHI